MSFLLFFFFWGGGGCKGFGVRDRASTGLLWTHKGAGFRFSVGGFRV